MASAPNPPAKQRHKAKPAERISNEGSKSGACAHFSRLVALLSLLFWLVPAAYRIARAAPLRSSWGAGAAHREPPRPRSPSRFVFAAVR